MRNMSSGLKTVANLVEAQGCLLRVSSELDKGTDVIFSV